MSTTKLHKTLKDKGVGAKAWANSFTEIEHLGSGKFAATIGGHDVFKDKADNKWKKRKVVDNRPDHILIRSARCCTEVYPYYATYYDVDHEEIRLHEERWVVQRLFKEPDTWRDVGAYNPIIVVEETLEGVHVIISYTTDYGPLVVDYFQKDANYLKHNITFENITSSVETFRVIQRWSGVVGAKCNGKNTPVLEDVSLLRFHNADKSQRDFNVAENLWSMIYNPDGTEKTEHCLQRPVDVEAHAQGMKVDFVYGNWILNQNEFLIIDPAVITITPPTEDTNLYNVGSGYNGGIWIKFDISAIGPAIASLAYLQLYQVYKLSNPPGLDTDARFWNINDQAWTEATAIAATFALAVSDQTDQAAGFGNGNGAYYNSCDIDTIVNVNLTPGDTFCSIRVMDIDYIMAGADTRDYVPTRLTIGHCWGPVGGRVLRDFEGREHVGGNDPKLYIEYLPSGWTGEISGVVNPAEVQGVAAADIAAIKGVA